MLDADVEVDRREFTVRAALRVGPGERLALFGPSGAGKTTLLEVIAGLVQPRRGPDRTRQPGPHLDRSPGVRRTALAAPGRAAAAEPGAVPPPVRPGQPVLRALGATVGPELSSLASVLGIDGLLSAMPARLSGGQAHRVALGRLLLAHCDALLLDEPYTGLDASLRRTLTDLVSSLVAERSVPAVLVTHELADAQAFADRLAVLDRGELLQAGAPDEVVLRPSSRRVAELIGYLGFVPAAAPGSAEQAVAGVHPERVIPGASAEQGPRAYRRGHGQPSGRRRLGSRPTSGRGCVVCRLRDKPPPSGGRLAATVLDPPYFASDGSALAAAPWSAGSLVQQQPYGS